MADKKITQLDAVTTAANTDLLLIVRDPSTSPVNRKMELGDVFGETAQTVFSKIDLSSPGNALIRGNYLRLSSNGAVDLNGNVVINSDKFILNTPLVSAPANSNNSFHQWPTGTFAYNANYLYIAVSSTLIARFAANTSW